MMSPTLTTQKCLMTLLVFLFSKYSFCQTTYPSKDLNKEIKLKRSHVSLEIGSAMVPKARISRTEGNSSLQSTLQLAYEGGINYIYNVNKDLLISSGLHVVLGERNYFINLPPEDVRRLNLTRNIILFDKEIWGAIRVPLLVEKKMNTTKAGLISTKAGLNLRYSGFVTDLQMGGRIIDSNNNAIDIFSASFSGNNDKKPWITFFAGASKLFVLDNKNILSVSLQADISTTYFYKANYTITIPDKPVTSGTYKINGTSLGLSVQYIFTGANKRLIPSAKVKAQEMRLKREDFLTDFVFTGNHLQFNFSTLSVLKARLRNENGNHPVSTRAALGLSLGFKYQINFNNEYSLITGPQAILSGRNFNTSFNKNDFSPPLINDYKLQGRNAYFADAIFSLPILAEKRWLYAKAKYLFADAGVCVNVSTGADFDTFFITLMNTNNGYYNAGGVDVYANNDAKPWVSFPINAGHAWLLKNNNLFQLSFCSNISFTKYVNGTYEINIPNKPITQGKYSSTGSFIGLSMNYVFTSANYRIRKEYEKKGYR